MAFLKTFPSRDFTLEISSSKDKTNEEKPGLEPIVCIAVSMPLKLSSIARLYERCALRELSNAFEYSLLIQNSTVMEFEIQTLQPLH